VRGCSVIVHLAALKIPRYGNRLGTLQVNATGTANVLAAAHHHGAEVVFASTSDCYGLNADVPFSETAHNVLGPSTIARWTYASSKLYSEHLCWAYHEEYGVPVTILRYFNSYGPREHRSWWGGPQAVFIEALLDNAPIELHGDGLQTRTFSYISDTVAGTMAALQNRAAHGELINIGGTDEITIVDLAAMVQESFGSLNPLDARYIPYEQIASRPYQDSRRRKADLTKARRILGFEPKVRLAEGLRHTIEWHRSVRMAGIA
jgi:UDP-glucose 4-epimerase